MVRSLRPFQKGLLYIFIILLSFSFVFSALGEEADMSVFVEPTLDSSVEYDSAHPEDLIAGQIYAKSAILIEAQSGKVIFEKNPDELLHPASTTKILTVFLGSIIGRQQELLNQRVYVSERAVDVPSDSSVIPLQVGEDINYQDLLYATMIKSGNDGSNVIAENAAGSIENFVAMMNEYVAAMGLTNTHFTNPHGYSDEHHYTTARDLALITKEAMEDELFRDIVKTLNYPLPASNINGPKSLSASRYRFLENTSDNKYYYPYGIGVKTGTTYDAGYCFVGAAEKDGITLLSVVLYSGYYNRWADTIKMMDYGFSQYRSTTPIELYQKNPVTVNVSGYDTSDEGLGQVVLDIVPEDTAHNPAIVVSQKEYDILAENFQDTVLVQYEKTDLSAPIRAGEHIATLYYFPEQGETATYLLTASRAVAKRENAPKTIAEIVEETNADPNPFPPLTFEIALFLILFLLILFFLLRGILRLFGRLPKKRKKLPKRQNRRYN